MKKAPTAPPDDCHHPASNPLKIFIISICLVVITIIIYQQVHHHGFVFDDDQYLIYNHNVQGGLTWKSLSWAFTSNYASNWHPLTWISHMLDCKLFGPNPGMHHLINVFLHIANTLLLFFVFNRMTNGMWQSAFVAALFAVHPLHVESVAWVAERKDILSTFFWFLTMWAYARYVKSRTIKTYMPVLLFFALALMSKPMAVTLPMVLLLMDFWPLNRFQSRWSGNVRLIKEKLPLLTLSIISCILTYWAQKAGGSIGTLEDVALHSRIANALVSYVAYLIKMIWPMNLAVFYPYSQKLLLWQTAGAFSILVLVSVLTIFTLKRFPYLFIGWAWYLGTLVPVIGLVQVGTQSMADRYTYLPLIGIFLMIAWGVPDLTKRLRYKTTLLTCLSVIILLAFSVSAYIQVSYWKNAVSLYEHSLHVTNNNHTLHYNLCVILAKQQRTTEAINHFQEALRITPKDAKICFSLGLALYKKGKYSDFVQYLRKTLELDPTYKKAHLILGLFFLEHGHINEGKKHFQEEIRINPDSSEAHYNLGVTMLQLNRQNKALTHFRETLRINPEFKQAKEILQRLGEKPD